MTESEFTKILDWPGYRVYRHEIDERTRKLRLWVRRKRGNRVLICSGCGGRASRVRGRVPGFTGKRQVSTNGGGQALWRKDGKDLFYLGLDGKLMAVDVKAGATIETGVPKALFQTPLVVSPLNDQYCVTADGRRFLIGEPPLTHIILGLVFQRGAVNHRVARFVRAPK